DFADAALAQRFVSTTLPAYDAVTVCSADDAALVAHPRVEVVPNGSSIRVDGYTASAGATLLFMGPFRYAPNLVGIRRFLQDAYPGIRAAVPGVDLIVLGGDEAAQRVRGDPLFAQSGVTVLGHREDVGALLQQSVLTV